MDKDKNFGKIYQRGYFMGRVLTILQKKRSLKTHMKKRKQAGNLRISFTRKREKKPKKKVLPVEQRTSFDGRQPWKRQHSFKVESTQGSLMLRGRTLSLSVKHGLQALQAVTLGQARNFPQHIPLPPSPPKKKKEKEE